MIISLYAGILALIYVALSFYVIRGRFKNRVSLGDNNNVDMQKRIRAHGNFIEYIPLALFLVFLMEVLEANALFIHILCITLIIGRTVHIFGLLNKDGASIARAGGMILTFIVIIIAAIYNIFGYL